MNFLNFISISAIPIIISIIIIHGLLNHQKPFDAFLEGAKEGLSTVVRLVPTLVGLMVAVGVFRASGAMDIIASILSPVLNKLGIPSDILTLGLMRPISGSASLAIVADIMKKYGPDSYFGKAACTIMGSSETIFYTLTVYFGTVGIKNIKYTLYAALITEVIGFFIAIWIWKVI